MDDLDVAGDNTPSSSTGITLVLPSLRALKAANAGKKSKSSKHVDDRLKPQRPVKLKPLKEVLTKLITQIKKKDDYAFFIHPVDTAAVPNYTDVIKNPMDFGTMMTKATKGKYRSLEEFMADFRLVTTNAKTFNPPGSIYYSEADRLEAWGLEHIARASAHVIEYETDWNIDIEQDEDAQLVNVEDEVSTPRDLDGSIAAGSPAPSITPAPGQMTTHGGKRGPRGPYKRHAQTTLSDGLDAEGRMPGAKDGVGAFPPGSGWAELMIALKIKGKRYKTKKERLRFEKEGPPYQPDGSLDYAEMEDPFSVLNVLVPEPPARPQVTSLYPPTSMPTTAASSTEDNPSQPLSYLSMPIYVPSNRSPPVLSTLSNVAAQVPIGSISTPALCPPKKRRHWTVVRNVSARSRAKDKEGDAAADDTKTNLGTPRDAGPVDYGTFATLLGDLVASAVAPNVGTAAMGAVEYMYGSEHQLYATIRSTIEHRGFKRKREAELGEAESGKSEKEVETFFTDERAEEAWDYLRNMVYGGVNGYAYVRSLAEFVAPSVYLDGRDGVVWEKTDEDAKTRPDERDAPPLGVPLPRYVEDNLVDAVARGRHGWLRDVFMPGAAAILDPGCATAVCGDGTTSPFEARVAALPGTGASLKASSEERLDMAALIRRPEELAKESVLEGGPVEGGERAEIERALAWSVAMIEELSGRVKVKEEAVDSVCVKAEEEEEEEEEAMDLDAGDDGPLMERVRLNLLALAKRAPLDKIAKLPAELVPEDIRGIVPIAQT